MKGNGGLAFELVAPVKTGEFDKIDRLIKKL